MAKTIDHMEFYVPVKPYTTEGNGDQVFDTLSMSVSYAKGKGFRANYHPGWKTGWGGFGCVFDFGSNPLTGTTWVDIEAAAKNNVKRLTQIKTNLEVAKDAIVWLFDERKWDELKRLVKDVAVCGYTYSIEERMKELRRYQNSDSTETTINQNNTTMATVEMNNETNNVQNNAQVNNETIDVNVGEVTLDSICPVMQPAEEKPAVTMPLGSHGTLVIGGVPKRDKNGKFLKKGEDKPKVQDSVPQAGKYQYVTYEVKKVNKTTKKEYTVTGSKIVGFELTDPIYLAGPAFCGAISTESVDGKTVGALRFSHKWTPAVKDVCDLLNSGKATLEGCVAIINGAKAERSERIQECIEKRKERKAKKAAKAQESEERRVKSEESANASATGYSDQDVADMLRKVMAGGDVPENIKKLLQAA